MKRILPFFILLYLVSSSSYAQPLNVQIGDIGKPNEPSIAINRKNPKYMVSAANIWNYYTSNDSGKSWTHHSQSSKYGVWGDPVLVNDTAGHFYYFHLSNPPKGSWIDRIVCQKSTDNGATWSEGTFMGKNGAKAQDKHWAVVDLNNNHIYVTWTQFDKYGSKDSTHRSNILFSKSIDNGETWMEPLILNERSGDCIDDDNTTEGAVPAVGLNGEVFVSWAGPAGLVFDKSLDGGTTWLENDIFIDSVYGGWSLDIPGINRCNGMPVTKCDLSNGKNSGTIYVNWSDQKHGSDDTDIWLTSSRDGGKTWAERTKVNQDTSKKHQFLTWMDIDQSNGNLYFIWYDRRNSDSTETEVYLSVSKDGGKTFEEHLISESKFTPVKEVFFGDYNNIVVQNGIIRPIWTRMDEGKTSVWTALVNEWLK